MQAKVVQALIDDLRDAGVQDSLIKRIAGHKDGAVTFSIYGSRSPLKEMADALQHIHITVCKSGLHRASGCGTS